MKPIDSLQHPHGPTTHLHPTRRRTRPQISLAILPFMVAILVGISAPSTAAPRPTGPGSPAQGRVIVANRGSASFSVIDARSDTVIDTVPLPEDVNRSEPMYPFHVNAGNQLFVGDRANDRVVVFDARTFAVESVIATGAGIWHMWADRVNRQLWVANDIDRTATVIDVIRHDVLATVPMPADLTALGGRPHDVFLQPTGTAAYVSMIGLPGPDDYVLKFDTETFAEVARAPVGKDPHLSLTGPGDLLFVPCQNSSEVVVLDPEGLGELASIPIPGAHGAVMRPGGRVFYTTNLPGGGLQALWAIDIQDRSVIGAPVDTPFPTAHNLAMTPDGRKLYLTHSGPTSTKVTVFLTTESDPTPVHAATVDVELNPFGITLIR